jgi:hypothetical protein
MFANLVDQNICGKTWHIHFLAPFGYFALSVIVR